MVQERSRARAWALQVLYAWECRERSAPLLEVLAEFGRERRIRPASRDYLQRILELIDRHPTEIDRALELALTNWRMERLALIDRSILRIAAAEILFADDVPPLVSIHEAIRLAERYGSDQSPRFVNGVLDALMKQSGPRLPAPTGEPN